MKKDGIILFFLLFVLTFTIAVNASDTMTVEANIFKFQSVVSIEVPEYIFIGNLTEGEETDNIKIYVNNTGTENIIVTPELADPFDIIFSNLYFRNRTVDQWAMFGNFSFGLSAPTTSGGKEDGYFYMKLDLTSFERELEEDLIGHKSDILFVAIAQE